MAKKVKKDKTVVRVNKEIAPKDAAPVTATSTGEAPPAQLMDLVESFLSDQGFDNAHREFKKHRAKRGWKCQDPKKSKGKEHHSLVGVFQTWETFPSKDTTPAATTQQAIEHITKVSSSDDSDSSESDSSDDDSSEDVAMADAPADADASSSESSSSSSSSSEGESGSGSDSDEEEATTAAAPAVTVIKTKTTANSRKRKAKSVSESSSSGSESDEDMTSSSSEDEKPKAKKVKKAVSSDESSASSSDSESESESDSSEDEVAVAAKVPLPESDSSSSESESEDEKPTKASKDNATNGTGSDTSATLDKTSPKITPLSTFAPFPPNPSTLKTNNRGQNGDKPKKVQNQPFSRIRNDVVVDPRLSSNAYVTHGYGEKAHQDLIITKGKGFTKEKNKKKRGSYKGGPLDVNMSRSIKFED
ncbi:Uu.00g123820.m01.CDS01 [Anthostomella pinea]|uniref:Uu.00g123820.m01.CDS01 n=1 Tax=Anthostomella pinea TaxID=933095 RepID=A0AAI8VHE1_9PEZI|nr:Uu.00g123820.m01.CDS01 [Anthostomella pinea]